ncbi:hypothetical protein GCM10027341_48960 [Spirosoma knui]
MPPELEYVSTIPASPTGDIAAINVTPNFRGSGRTRVLFQLINSLPAGSSGDLIVNVRFRNGSTPDGTVATNTADAINLGSTPGTFTTPPVTVTSEATVQVNAALTLQSSPANLDIPEQYRYRLSVPNTNGALNLTAVGPVVVTLPPGTVFNGATPAADCQPGCVGTTPATVTFTSPFALPLQPNQNGDILINVTFPSATFPSGINVTTSVTATGTPLGKSAQSIGDATITHQVSRFVAAPGAGFTVNMAGGTPNPPALNQRFSFDINMTNNGNVPLDNTVVIGTLPVELQVSSVTTGAYTGVSDFAAGEGVRVSYEKNTALGVFTLWGSSPNATTNTTLTAPPPGLGAGEYITRVRWEYGQTQPGMTSTTRPIITGRIINPDNAGGPVAIGDQIQFCAALSAVYADGPTNVNRNDCESFTLAAPFVQFSPVVNNLSGGGPFNPGQTISWRTRVWSNAQSSDPIPLQDVVAVSLLDERLSFSSWTFDDQGTGLPAPQIFERESDPVVIDGKKYTVLRWRWNAGSGNLGVNQQIWINISTTVKNLPSKGSVSVDQLLYNNSQSLDKRCAGSSITDQADLDQDGNAVEMVCSATGTANIACFPISVSVASGTAVCAGSSVTIAANVSGNTFGYQWLKNGTPATEVLEASVAPLSLTNVQAGDNGNYQLVVYGSCESVTSTAFSVTVSDPPTTVSLTASGTLTCAQTSVQLVAEGGNVGTTYQFSNGLQAGGLSSPVTSITAAGPYSVTLTTLGGCSVSASTTVTSNTTPPQNVSLINNGPLTCAQTSVTLTAASSSTGSLGYSFTGPLPITQSESGSPTATVSRTGTYTVTVTGSNGCSTTATTVVGLNLDAATVMLNNTGPLSFTNTTVTLIATTNPVGPFSYSFSQGAVQQGGSSGNTATVTATGVYSVTATRLDNGCTATASTTVTGGNNPTVCRGGTAVISVAVGGNPVKYEWYKNSLTTPKIMETPQLFRGTATSSLTIINAQTNTQGNFYLKVLDQSGTITLYGPYRLTVDASCRARELAQEITEPTVQVVILGNPLVNGQLRAVVKGAAGQPLRLKLVTEQGRSVRSEQWEQAAGEQLIEWDMREQPVGIYLLEVKANQQIQRHKLIKH